jgi:3-oxoacyl-[acyl-carrier-protein] synthase-3
MIQALGHNFPETVIGNAFFDQLAIDSAADWILDRIGIRQRCSVLSEEDILALRTGQLTRDDLVKAGRIQTLGSLAEPAWNLLKERAKELGHQIQPDLVIAGTSVPDWDIPANACAIASHLGLDCASFDVNSACSSFVVNLHVARSLIRSGAHLQVGIFNAERYSTRLNYSDRSSCVLFGDGAAAALVQNMEGWTPGPPAVSGGIRGFEVLDTVVHSNPSGHRHVVIPDGGTFSQNGAVVQKFAVTKTVAVTLELLEKNRFQVGDLSYFVGHQANLRMLTSVADKLHLKTEQHLYNVDQYGNQGGAGAPAVLSLNWKVFKPGDLVAVSVVGSGLTWGCALLRGL